MQHPVPCKRTVIVSLFLHTAIIITLALLAAHKDATPLVIIFCVAADIALTVYTAYSVINKSLGRQARELQERTKSLDDYAIELRLWAGEMSDQKRELQQRVDTINSYSDRIETLVTMIEALKKTADERKDQGI